MTTAQRARLQWELITAPEDEVLAVIEAQRLDPAFPAFARLCDEHGYPLYIVSDGFDFYIYPLLRKAHLEHLPVVANSLRYVQGAPEMRFLLQRGPDQYYANDKTYVMDQVRQPGNTLVYIGDGYSDRAAAHHADLLFAKDRLAEYCAQEHIAFEPFTTFEDIVRYFTEDGPAGAGRE
jgi:HAD superfamily phosphoserine phosphatase-like hydrolase